MTRGITSANTVTKSVPVSAPDPELEIAPNVSM